MPALIEGHGIVVGEATEWDVLEDRALTAIHHHDLSAGRDIDEDARPVSWIVANAAYAWGEDAKWELDGGTHPHEAHYLKLDCSKARELLGWRPVLKLEDAIPKIVDWYRAYFRNRHDSAFIRYQTEQEIERYQELLK